MIDAWCLCIQLIIPFCASALTVPRLRSTEYMCKKDRCHRDQKEMTLVVKIKFKTYTHFAVAIGYVCPAALILLPL